jgi:DNA-binding SARP family transcriptional activator
VLSRTRALCGDVIVRREDVLSLAENVSVDANEFEAAVSVALTAAASGDPMAGSLARTALETHRGELLPADRYSNWSAAPRERFARRCIEVTEVLVDEAVASNDANEAVRLLERIIELEPYDERYYIRAAQLAADRGWHSREASFVRRAAAVTVELGRKPSPAIEELQARLDMKSVR